MLRPGQDIAGRYEVRERIGGGGMGAVWRVHDRKLDEDIALKVILPDRMGDPASLSRLRDEVKLARKITHPNVCRVFDIGESGALTFLTMELVHGTTLRKLLAGGPIEPERALDMLQQITGGVAAAHERGILHRDLKPENVLVRHDGRCLVADFGLAHEADSSAGMRDDRAGTPAYMSPEQLRGEALDLRSDVFALGLLAYELFSGKSVEAVRRAIVDGEAPSLDAIAGPEQAALRAVIARALARARSARFESAAALGAALALAREQIESPSAPRGLSRAEANATTGATARTRASGLRLWHLLLAPPLFVITCIVIVYLLTQLPRGDLRDWHPFSGDDETTAEDKDQG